MGPVTTPRGPLILLRLLVLACAVGAMLVLGRADRRSAAVPPWFASLPAGEQPRELTPGLVVVRKVRQQRETRNAMFSRTGTLSSLLRPERDTRVQLAMSLLCPPQQTCRGQAVFHATVRNGSTRDAVLARTLTVDGDDAAWESDWIDLGRYAGQAITLELRTDAPTSGGTAGAALPLPVWGEPLVSTHADPPRPNVLLISLDTLRADRLGCFGYDQPTSPAIDALAATSVRFARAISQSPWTTPAHMSLFTAQYPSAHRMNQTWDYFLNFLYAGGEKRALADGAITLAETLRQHGYRTLAMTGGATMSSVLGFAQGFDIYREDAARLTPRVSVALDQWLEQFGRQPFFLFFHTFEVHAPYSHLRFAEPLLPADDRRALHDLIAAADLDDWVTLNRRLKAYLGDHGLLRREITSALYDGGVAAADAFMGDLFETLRRRGLFDDTIIVLLSDHGEEFGEHEPVHVYNAHGESLYDELIHVPLIIRYPRHLPTGASIEQQVELVDVMPTLLDLVGIPPPAAMSGTSLLPLAKGVATPRREWALSEAMEKGLEWKALRTPRFKYLLAFDPSGGERSGVRPPIVDERLFDLERDPGEQRSVLRENPDQAQAMRAQIEELLTRLAAADAAAQSVVVAPDVIERLRALGYAE